MWLWKNPQTAKHNNRLPNHSANPQPLNLSMLRSLLAIITGYLSIAFLNSLTRLIVALYFRTDIQLSGVSHLPSPFWQYVLIVLYMAFGLFGGLITCSIVQRKYGIEILVLICLILTAGFFEYEFLNTEEPLWYLVCSPLAKITGVWGGYRIKLSQDQKLSTPV